MFSSSAVEFFYPGDDVVVDPSSANDVGKLWSVDNKGLADESKWLEATSDLQAFMDLTEVTEVDTEVTTADTEQLIDKMEEFIQACESRQLSADTEEMIDLPLDPALFTQEETEAAEQWLDSLIKEHDLANVKEEDEVSMSSPPGGEEIAEEDEVGATEVLDDSGFIDMDQNNVQQVVTQDGRHIFVVIAPVKKSPVFSPPAKATKGRPLVERSDGPRKMYQRRGHGGIVDKKERKKRQNVEAARRYRDKKKSEQATIEMDEQALTEKNKELKSKVTELESEVKTMRKLMIELNILKNTKT